MRVITSLQLMKIKWFTCVLEHGQLVTHTHLLFTCCNITGSTWIQLKFKHKTFFVLYIIKWKMIFMSLTGRIVQEREEGQIERGYLTNVKVGFKLWISVVNGNYLEAAGCCIVVKRHDPYQLQWCCSVTRLTSDLSMNWNKWKEWTFYYRQSVITIPFSLLMDHIVPNYNCVLTDPYSLWMEQLFGENAWICRFLLHLAVKLLLTFKSYCMCFSGRKS